MPELGYSTSHFWGIAGFLLIACNAMWPFVVAIVALLVAARKKQGFAFVALFGALLAAAGHAVRLSGVTVHSSSANIPLPLVSENYAIYFLFFHALSIGMAIFGAAYLYASVSRRI
jgi:hypothetical protein